MKLGYRRLSSEQQTDGLSLEAQQKILEKAECDRIYTDIESGWRGKSGESSDREDFQKMLADARQLRSEGWPVEIVFPEFTRWARNTITSMGLIEELEAEGITLRSMDIGPISVQTAGQWLNTMQQSVMAEFYSRQLSDKLQRTYELKRNTGRPLQHKQPFGWALSEDKSKLVPNTNLWKSTGRTPYDIADELIKMYIAGSSLEACAKRGIELELPWAASTFRKWMLNPIHQGHTWWYKQKLKKGEHRSSKNNEREILYNTHEPLITPSQFAAIQQRLKDGKQIWGRNTKGRLNVLRGLAICADCGRKLGRDPNPTTANPDWSTLRCYNNLCKGSRYGHDYVEEALVDTIREHAQELAERGSQPLEAQKPAQLIALEQQREQLLQMIENTKLPGLTQALQELDTKIKQFDRPLPAELSTEETANLIELLSTPSEFMKLPDNTRRIYYTALCDSIIVKVSGPLKERGIVEINLKF